MRRIQILVPTVLATIGLLTGGLLAGAAAQDTSDLADHPLTGTWMGHANAPLATDPQVFAPSYFGADGSVLLLFPLTQRTADGVQFNTPYVGTWVADGPHRGHFTATQLLSDATGANLGSVTVDGFPVVSDDGQTFIDDGSLVTVTIRDPEGAIVGQFPGVGGRPVTGIRMGGGSAGFPEASPTASAAP